MRFLRALCHPASTLPGRKFQLYPWQERIIRAIYGPRDILGNRIVRDVFLLIGRGNRKTSLAAAMALLHLLGPEKVPNGQAIFAAADREQAGIGFREAADIVRMMPTLTRATKIYDAFNSAKMIRSGLDGSTLKAVASDGRAQHGTTPTFVLVDEIHAWRANGRELWQALQTGMAKRPGGLTVTATTAGRGREGLAAERYAYARKVALGKIIDPSFLPIMFEMQDDDDWTDETVWHRCNPGLADGFQDIGKLRIDAKRAEIDLSAMYDFQQYHLCRWMGNSTAPLFNFDEYDARAFKDDEADLEGLPCYLGVDYAQSGDLAAIVAAWRHDDGQVTIKPWFFVCGERLEDRERLEQTPYRQWINEELIIKAAGPIITQEEVAAKVHEICAQHEVEQVRYDPSRFQAMATKMYSDGLPMLEMRQYLSIMGPANGELIRAVNGRIIRHDGNPVLRHHFDGVAAVERNGLIWMSKADQKRGHIDGAIAASMAVSSAVTAHDTKSRYESSEVSGLSAI
ncbi:MAG: terminase large subunit [Hyphomonas sp.]